jgi:hypothetical protein
MRSYVGHCLHIKHCRTFLSLGRESCFNIGDETSIPPPQSCADHSVQSRIGLKVLHRKAAAATARALALGVPHHCERASYHLRDVVNGTAPEKVQRRLIHDYSHAVPHENDVLLGIDRAVLPPIVGIAIRCAPAILLREEEELVLEAAAPPRVDVQAQVDGIGVRTGGRQLSYARGAAGGDDDAPHARVLR